MTTLYTYRDRIEKEVREIAKASPIKKVFFGDLDAKVQYPSVYFLIKNCENVDDFCVPTVMRIGWELSYDIMVLHSGISAQQTIKDSQKIVDVIANRFIEQMSVSELFDDNAFELWVDTIRYGDIEMPADTENVHGGIIELRIKFYQEV